MTVQFVAVIFAFVFTVGAFASLFLRWFYPYHRIIALALYTVSWGLSIYSVWFYRDFIFMRSERLTDLLIGYIPFFAWIGISFIFIFFLWFFRFREFGELSTIKPEEFGKISHDDTALLGYLDQFLEENVCRFEKSLLVDEEKIEFSSSERQSLRILWKAVFDGVVEIDMVRSRYEDFYVLGGNRRDDHLISFLIYYNCVLLQHYYTHRVQKIIGDREVLEKILDDHDDKIGLPENSYSLSVGKIIHAGEIVQINLGRAYSALISEEIDSHALDIRSQEILAYVDDHIHTYTLEIFKNPLKRFEKSVTTTFFPWQKKIAYGMSLIRVSERPFLITDDFIKDQHRQMEPGDVLLQRREWFATNIGIPGYWTHSALYIGSLDDVNTFFSQLPEFENDLPSEYIAKEFPAVYEQLRDNDSDGHKRCVIEVKSPGVIITSFEQTAGCDALAVLRPTLSPQQKWQMVTQAMKYFGLPYDYNFDFSTDGSLVCSELIYKALEGLPDISLEATMTNGRLLFTPNQFIEKFDRELESERQSFEFVLFWDGDEKTEVVHERDVAALRESWRRPKWHVLGSYLEENSVEKN